MLLLFVQVPHALGANSVTVESKTVDSNSVVSIGVSIVNDEPIRYVVCPLIIRSISGDAFPASISINRVPGSRIDNYLQGIVVNNGYLVYDSLGCHSGEDFPGFKPVAWDDSLDHPVVSPAGVMFVRGIFMPTDPVLPPGEDSETPSFKIMANIGPYGGIFEIDTTCMAQNNHLVFVSLVGGTNTRRIPDFVRGIVTVNGPQKLGCECGRAGDITDDRVYDVMDVVGLIDYAFGQGARPPRDPLCPFGDRGDANCDGVDDVFDIMWLIDFVFKNGTPPCGWCPCPPDWTRASDGSPVTGNSAMALQVDDAGMVYVTGYEYGFVQPYTVTLKYSPSGQEIWRREDHDGGDEIPYAMKFGPDGNLYIAGVVAYGGGGGYLILKYDTSGTLLWKRVQFFGTGHARATAVCIDPFCNVYVAGESRYTDIDPYDYGLLKFDSTGTFLWERHFGPGSAFAIVSDTAGNTYTTGTAGTVKHDPNGTKVWRDYDAGSDITMDVSGMGVIVAGSSIRHYDAFGSVDWSNPHLASKVRRDDAGNIYTLGNSVCKFNSILQLLWEDYIAGNDLELTSSGQVVVTGSSTVAYNPNGTRLWQTDVVGKDLGIDADGSVYVTGSRNSDIITSKIPSGGPCGVTQIGRSETLGPSLR